MAMRLCYAWLFVVLIGLWFTIALTRPKLLMDESQQELNYERVFWVVLIGTMAVGYGACYLLGPTVRYNPMR